MESSLRRLVRACAVFGDVFYSVEARAGAISLQGKFNSHVMKKALKLGFDVSHDYNGFVVLKRKYYVITLTD